MKSIRNNFYKELKGNPNLGEYPALAKTVRGKNYSRRTLSKNIYLLDDKDIDASMKKSLVDHLYEQTQKLPEECKNECEIVSDNAKSKYLSVSAWCGESVC